MRFYHDYDNRRGKNYGAGMSDGCGAHTRGWHAGVKVRIGKQDDHPDLDEVMVWMTSGSGGHGGDTYLGVVRETKAGPRWIASAQARPSRSARAAALRDELAGLREQIADARAELDNVPAAARRELTIVRSQIAQARAELDDVPAAARRELASVHDQIAQARRELAAVPPRSKDEDNPGIARHALQHAIDALEGAAQHLYASGHEVSDSMEMSILDLRGELGRLDKPPIRTELDSQR
jgi:hypothetical protein